jgi:glycosyltransferase involved in cell wall biosynthesis
MITVYDCSLNDFAPKHRPSNLGPKENDIMFDLKKYQKELGIQFIDDFTKADRIITNTTYTPEILRRRKSDSKLIKRMDGVYWRTDLIERNASLNEAAHQSDSVIFISKFSQDSFHSLYNQTLKDEYVILNNVDEAVFTLDSVRRPTIKCWGTNATNWICDEKRPIDLLKFANLVSKYDEFILVIGSSFNINHPAIINNGYYTNYNLLNDAIHEVDAWINFSYRDAAPKTVVQAIKCGKPVLYANSGGLPELVGSFGLAINDYQPIEFSDKNHELDFDHVEKQYMIFREMYNQNKFTRHVKPYLRTLEEYVEIITK